MNTFNATTNSFGSNNLTLPLLVVVVVVVLIWWTSFDAYVYYMNGTETGLRLFAWIFFEGDCPVEDQISTK